MKTAVETITPKKAREYLLANKDNYRKLSRHKVNQYAEDMKAGRWQMNGQGIAFGKNQILKDGQHRLAAIVQAGVPVEMTVNRDLDDNVTIFDVGMMRSATQIVLANKVDLPKQAVSAAAAIVGRFQNAPKGQVVEYAIKHEGELMRAYKAACYGNGIKKMSIVLAAYLALRENLAPFYELEVFFRIFNSRNTVAADGYEPSSALVAAKMFDDRTGRTSQTIQKEQLEILILAIRDFHAGQARQMNYRLKQPFTWEALIEELRKEDGVE